MTFGTSKWEGSPWVLDEEESLKVIKTAYDHGINTWVRMVLFGDWRHVSPQMKP